VLRQRRLRIARQYADYRRSVNGRSQERHLR
jgi:hypothetical protein